MKFFDFAAISFSLQRSKLFHASIKICTAKHTFFTDNIHFSLFSVDSLPFLYYNDAYENTKKRIL